MKRVKLRTVCLLLLVIYIFSAFGLAVSADFDDSIYASAVLSDKSSPEIDVSSRIYEALFGASASVRRDKSAPLMLIASGDAFGIKINEERPSVTRLLKNTAFAVGDKILELDGVEIYSVNDVRAVLKAYTGGTLRAKVLRGGREEEITVKPSVNDGTASLDVEIKDSSIGIGTITFIDPLTNVFGGLGHGVCDSLGEPVKMKSAIATSAILTGIKRGESGKPGELCGALGKGVLGSITVNSDCGVFGILDSKPLSAEDAIPVGKREDLKCGKAEIISTLKNGKKSSYEIEISDIDYSSTNSKSFKIKVTDEALIAISGGIVRGMSGSPIIQDGKLVGAVTHVMVADSTEGYGIFIENMLNATNNQSQQKAA